MCICVEETMFTAVLLVSFIETSRRKLIQQREDDSI
jgi:hypothetical protein